MTHCGINVCQYKMKLFYKIFKWKLIFFKLELKKCLNFMINKSLNYKLHSKLGWCVKVLILFIIACVLASHEFFLFFFFILSVVRECIKPNNNSLLFYTYTCILFFIFMFIFIMIFVYLSFFFPFFAISIFYFCKCKTHIKHWCWIMLLRVFNNVINNNSKFINSMYIEI